jgi:hypothetical protein
VRPIGQEDWGEQVPRIEDSEQGQSGNRVVVQRTPTPPVANRAEYTIEVCDLLLSGAGTALGLLLPQQLGLGFEHVHYHVSSNGGDVVVFRVTDEQMRLLTSFTDRLQYVDQSLRNFRKEFVSLFSFSFSPSPFISFLFLPVG